jgi:DNA replication licensing factor MCM4
MCVYDELVDVAKAGDRLEVTAIFRAVPVRVNPRKRTVRAIYRTFLDVVHIKKSDAKRLAMDPSITGPDEAVVRLVGNDCKFQQLNLCRPVISYDESDNIQNVGLDDQAKIEELAKDPNIYDILARSLGA